MPVREITEGLNTCCGKDFRKVIVNLCLNF